MYSNFNLGVCWQYFRISLVQILNLKITYFTKSDTKCLLLFLSLQPISKKFDYGAEDGVCKVSRRKGVFEQVVQHSCDAVRPRYGKSWDAV